MSFNPRWFQVTDQQIHNWCQSAPDLHTAAAAWVHEIPEDQVTPGLRKESKMILFGRTYGMTKQTTDRYVQPVPAQELADAFKQAFPKLAALYFDAAAGGTLRPAYTIKATARYPNDPHAPGTTECQMAYPDEDGNVITEEDHRLPELGPKRTFASGRLHPFKPLVLDIKGRRFKVTVSTLEFRDGDEPGEVTFEETTEPETPFEVWDAKTKLEQAIERLKRTIAESKAAPIPAGSEQWMAERWLAEYEAELSVGDYSRQTPSDQTSAFGQPVFIQGKCFPTHEGKAAYHLLTFETNWGDCGNENYMVALDDDGYPIAVFHEASCS